MNEKNQMLEKLQRLFRQWDDLLTGLSEAQISTPQTPSPFTTKDYLVHLWAWQQLSIARLEAAVHNRPPEFSLWPEISNPDDHVQQINDWVYQTYRDKPWSTVYWDWRAGFERFLSLAEQISEADFLETGKYGWLGEYPLMSVLEGSYEHHEEHLGWLRDWLSQHSVAKNTE
jgi:hypothetical protein